MYYRLLLSFLFLIPSGLFAQVNPKANSSFIIKKKSASSEIRAVIVGISDYENEDIPDLQYAHKDALAFAEFLKSPSGGSVNPQNIKFYINNEATGGNIHKALYWLLKESKENDLNYIYFSGHGDVETIYNDEPGHFLVYDSPSSIYQINSLRLDDLRRIINTLTSVNKSQVVMISDACRSGKLAGSEVNGAQATTAALAAQFSNEVKIMSCQPDEYSVEGKQWGGGRGLFSYHLIEGLIGMADQNDNQEIVLKEIQRYLEDQFDLETSNIKQTPVTVGDRNQLIAQVDLIALDALRLQKFPDQSETLVAAINEKSSEDDLLEKFYSAIAEKNLLSENPQDKTASYYFAQINLDEKYSAKAPIIKGDLIAALQDDAQKAINNYLSLDPEELNRRWFSDKNDYGKYSKFLNEAARLAGDFHYLFPQLKTKAIYFDVVSERIQLQFDKAKNSEYGPLVEKLNSALIYQSRSPFVYNELGLLHLRIGNLDEAIKAFDECLSMSPNWAMALSNKSFVYQKKGELDKSIKLAKAAIEISPDFTSALTNLSISQIHNGQYEEALKSLDKYLSINPTNCSHLTNKGLCLLKLKRYEEADSLFNSAIECNPKLLNPHINKSLIYRETKQFPQAIEELNVAVSKNPYHAHTYHSLGLTYEDMGKDSEAIEYYGKAIELDSNHYCRYYQALLFLKSGETEKAIQNLNYYLEHVEPLDKWALFDNACAHAVMDDYNGFKSLMDKSIEAGFSSNKELEEINYLQKYREKGYIKEYIDRMK